MNDKAIKLVFELQRKVERLEKRVAFLEREREPKFFVDKPVDKVVDN